MDLRPPDASNPIRSLLKNASVWCWTDLTGRETLTHAEGVHQSTIVVPKPSQCVLGGSRGERDPNSVRVWPDGMGCEETARRRHRPGESTATGVSERPD